MGTANSILNSIYDEENIDRASAKVKHAAQQGNGSGSQNSNAETMPPVLEHAEENAITFVYPGFQKLTFASIRSVFDHDLGITLYDYRKPAPNVYTGAVNTKIPGNRIIEATVEFSSDEISLVNLKRITLNIPNFANCRTLREMLELLAQGKYCPQTTLKNLEQDSQARQIPFSDSISNVVVEIRPVERHKFSVNSPIPVLLILSGKFAVPKSMPVMKDNSVRLEISTFEFFRGEPGLEYHGWLHMEETYKIPAFLRYNQNQLIGNLPTPLELKGSRNKPIQEGLTIIKICYDINVKWYRDIKSFESSGQKLEEILENQKSRVTSLNRRVPKIYGLLQKYAEKSGIPDSRDISIASIKLEYNPTIKRYFVDDMMIHFNDVSLRGNQFKIQNFTLNWRELLGEFKSAWSSTLVNINVSEGNFLSGKFDMRWMPFDEIKVYNKSVSHVFGELSSRVDKEGTLLLQGDSRFFHLTEGEQKLGIVLNGLNVIGSIKNCSYSFGIIRIPTKELLVYLSENENEKGSFQCHMEMSLPIGALKLISNSYDPSKQDKWVENFTYTNNTPSVSCPAQDLFESWSVAMTDDLKLSEDASVTITHVFMDMLKESLLIQGKIFLDKKRSKSKPFTLRAEVRMRGVATVTIGSTVYQAKMKSSVEYEMKQEMDRSRKNSIFVDTKLSLDQ